MTADRQIPLFPLRSVLFPGGLLQLQVFEVRYLEMIGRCHREGLPFGVVCLIEGAEVQQPAADGSASHYQHERFHQIGTLAHVEQLERPRAGLMGIRCRGGQRFKLQGSERLQHGLWMGEVELLPNDLLMALPDDLERTGIGLAQVVDEFREQGIAEADLPVLPPWHFDDCGWVANRWCELLPLTDDTRQQLLEVQSPLLRLELVSDALDHFESEGGA